MTALVTNVQVFPQTSKIDFTESFSNIDFLLLAKIFTSVKLVVLTFISQYPAS